MATAPKLKGTPRISKEAQAALITHVRSIMTAHGAVATELRNKLTVIDMAYARYSETKRSEDGAVLCNIMAEDDVVAPIVVSEVDSMVAYLADVFLSGAPLFPVVSTPKNRQYAEMLETLIDDHAMLGGYSRQLLLFLLDTVKYNFGPLENTWDQIEQFSVEGDFTTAEGRKVAKANKSYTAVRRLDPYNTVYDHTVSPADVSAHGDYAGDVQIISRMKLKRLLQKLKNKDIVMNEDKCVRDNSYVNAAGVTSNYYSHPTVSEYISAFRRDSAVDWYKYFGDSRKPLTGPGNFELITLYIRIIPADFLMNVPQDKSPQIYKLQVINNNVIISCERIISAFDTLPVSIGQAFEDGMGLQTKSVAEGSISFQEAATTLFNIRFAAARRSVSDRALYDPDMISPGDINTSVAAPKIPVRGSAMREKNLQAAYHQIPFDMRGTETTLQDAATIASFSKELSGISAPRRGQFQKGNKSVTEWNDTMGAGDDRLRLRALCLESQVFIPLKENIKLNIFQYGDDAVVVSQKTGVEYNVKIDELRKQVLAFKIADGYSPKSKLASIETLTMGFQMISSSPILQESFGSSLPGVFAHLMSLGGVKGFEEYDPANAMNQQAPQGLTDNSLQGMGGNAVPSAVVPTEPGVSPSMPIA